MSNKANERDWMACAHVLSGQCADLGWQVFCGDDTPVCMCEECVGSFDDPGVPPPFIPYFVCPACLRECLEEIATVHGREYVELAAQEGHTCEEKKQ